MARYPMGLDPAYPTIEKGGDLTGWAGKRE